MAQTQDARSLAQKILLLVRYSIAPALCPPLDMHLFGGYDPPRPFHLKYYQGHYNERLPDSAISRRIREQGWCP